MEKVKKIWLDGKLVNWEDANIHILAHTLHYGGGAFEGIRAYDTSKGVAVFRLPEHIDRFFYSAESLQMNLSFSKDEIRQAILKTIDVNEVKECYIRPMAFLGYGKMGLNPKGAPVRVAVAVWPWGAYLGEKPAIDVKISNYIRIHPDSTIADAKLCGNYVNSILASQEIKKEGYDEALFLDYDGWVAEGPGENIFLIKDKKLLTPSAGPILPGITRDSVIKIADNLGIEVEEKKITVEELKSAAEAFFVGTAAEVCPIRKIDETVINEGKVGKLTSKIKGAYDEVVRGKKQKYLDWLTFVKNI